MARRLVAVLDDRGDHLRRKVALVAEEDERRPDRLERERREQIEWPRRERAVETAPGGVGVGPVASFFARPVRCLQGGPRVRCVACRRRGAVCGVRSG
eukprot:2631813-Prymnesium_polylepis.1